MTNPIQKLSHQFFISLKLIGFILIIFQITSMEAVRPIQVKTEKRRAVVQFVQFFS